MSQERWVAVGKIMGAMIRFVIVVICARELGATWHQAFWGTWGVSCVAAMVGDCVRGSTK